MIESKHYKSLIFLSLSLNNTAKLIKIVFPDKNLSTILIHIAFGKGAFFRKLCINFAPFLLFVNIFSFFIVLSNLILTFLF